MIEGSLRNHNVIIVGKLSAPLDANLDEFSVSTAQARSVVHQISDTGTALEHLPDVLFQHSVDWTWLFVNASDVYTPAVSSVVALASKLSPLYIHCYNDLPFLGSDDALEVPDSWQKHGMQVFFCNYDDTAFHVKSLFHAITHTAPSTPNVIPSDCEIDPQDPRYLAACDIVRAAGQNSISLVQRTLHISYSYAAALVRAMGKDLVPATQKVGVISDSGALQDKSRTHDLK